MKIHLTLITIIISLSIFFYPTHSISNGIGSPGGKTNSPIDGQNCTQCHTGSLQTNNNIAWITSNIPSNGYTIGDTYTITINADGDAAMVNKYGFELTAENTSGKTGDFFITDNTTKLVNINTSVTHKLSGTSGGAMKQWSVDWTPTASSTDSTNFYAAIMLANSNNNNAGDIVYTTTLTVLENQITALDDIKKNDFVFNSTYKTITSNEPVIIYDIQGKKILKTNKETTNISRLESGLYLLKSKNQTQKIILH